jgi:hypothetical protein
MAGHVISHRRPRRKRPGAWAQATRRFGMLIVTLIALAVASWIAPYVYRPAPPALKAPARSTQALPQLAPANGLATAASAEAAAAMTENRRAARPRSSVPLDATPASAGEDYEVLSAAELDAISQARH